MLLCILKPLSVETENVFHPLYSTRLCACAWWKISACPSRSDSSLHSAFLYQSQTVHHPPPSGPPQSFTVQLILPAFYPDITLVHRTNLQFCFLISSHIRHVRRASQLLLLLSWMSVACFPAETAGSFFFS